MLDRKLFREDPERIVEGARKRNVSVDVDGIVALDREYLDNMRIGDELKHERNVSSEEIGRRKREGQDAEDLHEAMKKTAARIKEIEARNHAIDDELESLLLAVPNIPHDTVPVGHDESANVVVREHGEAVKPFDDVEPHWDIGEKLGLLDLDAGRNVSGRGFIVLRGDGARLNRALINLMLDIHLEQGYEEMVVPFLVRTESMVGTGQLPKMAEDMYRTTDDMWLVPTAEVPLTNIHRDTQIALESLPIRYTAYSPCFRREAGAHGADTRGLIRVHQFDKVEMVKFVRPEGSYDELESLVDDAVAVLDALELPYRVVSLATGDLSFAAAKCYDLEVFAPGVDKWLEVSSCSNFEDFQARRAGIRIKKSKETKHRFVHTLNGSGLALPRVIAAILEMHQTPTGRVRIPEKLRAYMGGQDYLG